MCYLKELSEALVNAVEYSLTNEIELFKRLEEENFDVIRLTKRERQKEILKNIKVRKLFISKRVIVEFESDKPRSRQMYLSEDAFDSGNECGRCLLWRFSSSITWGNFFAHGKNMAHLLDIGTWTPRFGVNLTDVVFPHIAHGFRGINLPIATYHVGRLEEKRFRQIFSNFPARWVYYFR